MKFIKNIFFFFFKKHKKKTWIVIASLLLIWWFSLPSPLFKTPTCVVLEDKNGDLLGAKIAADGQWRFPNSEDLPEKFIKAILEFEDRRFYKHPGIDPVGIARAIKQNIKNKKVVSGGSTISMQVIRLTKGAKRRTIFRKLIEMFIALRLEIKYSKKEILAFYASNAPFGGNVVGLEAASWRYFGKKPELLTWAESATLAVLPNSPGLIHPGRNRKSLFEKRNRLLKRLFDKGDIDKMNYELSLEEPLPDKPLPLPQITPHLMARIQKEILQKNKAKIKTTIDRNLQIQTTEIISRHHELLKNNDIHNLAAIIIDVETGNVLAYVGNVPNVGKEHHGYVDIIKAPRSTGSILKPFLYAFALQEGKILPGSLLSDIPTSLNGYKPQNFYENYDGVVPADRALIRSLNIPAVRLLQMYGLEKFHFKLKKMGFTTLTNPATHYGLTLILGGAEGTLWDITNAYAYMGRIINHFPEYDGEYNANDFFKPNYILNDKTSSKSKNLVEAPPIVSASAAWLTFNTIRSLERPTSEGEWEKFQSGRPIAWKTGTSIGFRDAWAVGITSRYAVGVWAGNADGEGRPGLIGVKAAAPTLFDIFNLLPYSDWFDEPVDEMPEIEICKKSGYIALEICEKDTIRGTINSINAPACPYHKIIHLNKEKTKQVHADCENPLNIVHQPWFILPPIEEFYYKRKSPGYITLPPFRKDCEKSGTTGNPMQIIYPRHLTKIYVPIDLNGKPSKTVFKVAHRNMKTKIYWHLDNEYIGTTKDFHSFELYPEKGKHKLVLVDEKGNRLVRNFEVTSDKVNVEK